MGTSQSRVDPLPLTFQQEEILSSNVLESIGSRNHELISPTEVNDSNISPKQEAIEVSDEIEVQSQVNLNPTLRNSVTQIRNLKYAQIWQVFISNDNLSGAMNWFNDKNQHVFHFNPRRTESRIVLNSKLNGWGREESIPLLNKSSDLDVTIAISDSGFEIFVSHGSSIPFYHYRHRAESRLFRLEKTSSFPTGWVVQCISDCSFPSSSSFPPNLIPQHDLSKEILLSARSDGSKVHVGQKGWPGGWLTTYPKKTLEFQFPHPTLLTSLFFYFANYEASPRNIHLYFQPPTEERWIKAFSLKVPDRNRFGSHVSSVQHWGSLHLCRFYLYGDEHHDARVGFFSLGETANNHCVVTSHPNEEGAGQGQGQGQVYPVSSKWKLEFPDTNGTHYIGINDLRFHGITNPLPPPIINDILILSSMDMNPNPSLSQQSSSSSVDSSSFTSISETIQQFSTRYLISWTYHYPSNTSEFELKSFKIIAYPMDEHSLSQLSQLSFSPISLLLTGGLHVRCVGSSRSILFPPLNKDVIYAFRVVAIDSRGDDGVPSAPKLSPNFLPSSSSTPILSPSMMNNSENLGNHSSSSSSSSIVEQSSSSSSSSIESSKMDPFFSSSDPSFDSSPTTSPTTTPSDLPLNRINDEIQRQNYQEQENLLKRSRLVPTANLSVSHYSDLFESSLLAVLKGDMKEIENVKIAQSVTMFVSSTFDDTVTERNYLTEFAFPLLTRLCDSFGLKFSAVDLRWGVRHEMADEHMTIDICLGELARCLKSSTAAAFVFFSGERYGWRALPNKVLASEMEIILTLLEERTTTEGHHLEGNMNAVDEVDVVIDPDALCCFREWYVKDDNMTSDPLYYLQRISIMSNKPNTQFPNFWSTKERLGAQNIMQTAIWKLMFHSTDPRLTEEIRRNWTISVTEREVMEGIFKIKDNIEMSSLMIKRTITNLSRIAINDNLAKVYYTFPEEDRTLLEDLRERVQQIIPSSSYREYEIDWSNDKGIHLSVQGEYIRELAYSLVSDVEQRIRVGIQKRRLLTSLESEVHHHMSFAFHRSSQFLGRSAMLYELESFLLNRSSTSPTASSSTSIKVIHGHSGCGKTSVMCALAKLLWERESAESITPNILLRICGTSPGSSSCLNLMKSISEQLHLLLMSNTPAHTSESALPPFNPVNGVSETIAQFHSLLQLTSQNRNNNHPVYIFLDSLDQLQDDYGLRSDVWKWLPTERIENIIIVVSTLPDAQYKILSRLRDTLTSPQCYYHIPNLDLDQALALKTEFLHLHGRRLQPEQDAIVEEIIRSQSLSSSSEGGIGMTMLHLKLLLEQAAKLKSTDIITSLPRTLRELIFDIYLKLEDEHGRVLVTQILRLLLTSEGGLSLDNFNDLISADDQVLGKKGERGAILEFFDPPIRRLPPLVLTRFRLSLGEFVSERESHGYTVLRLFHRQFIEAAEDRYFPPSDPNTSTYRQHCSRLLADYFSGNLSRLFPERNLCPHPLRFSPLMNDENDSTQVKTRHPVNYQKLSEYPHSLRLCGDVASMVDFICDLRVIEASFEAKGFSPSNLIEHFQFALKSNDTLSQPQQKRLNDYFNFLCKWFQVLTLDYTSISSLACNSPLGSQVRLDAPLVYPENQLEWLNPPSEVDPCIMSFQMTKSPNVTRWSPSGDSFAFSGEDTIVKVFDAANYQLISTFTHHTLPVTALAFSPDGSRVLSVGFDAAMVWEVSTGNLIETLTRSSGRLLACEWTRLVLPFPPTTTIATTHSQDNEKSYREIIFIGGAQSIISLWDALTFQRIGTLEGHSSTISSMSGTSDGQYLASSSTDGIVVLWTIGTNYLPRRLAVIQAHSQWINRVRWLSHPLERMFATCSDDKTIQIWKQNSLGSFNLIRTLSGFYSEVLSVSFLSETHLAAVGADRTFRVFSIPSGLEIVSQLGHSRWVVDVDVHPKTRKGLTISTDTWCRVWDMVSFLSFQNIDHHPQIDEISNGLGFLGRELRLISKIGQETRVDFDTRQVISILPSSTLPKTGDSWGEMNSRGDWLFPKIKLESNIVQISSQTVSPFKLIDQDTPLQTCWHPLNPNQFSYLTFHLTPTIIIYDISSKKQIKSIPLDKCWYHGLAWSPDGRFIGAGGQAGTLIVDISSSNVVHRLPPARVLEFSPDSSKVCLSLMYGVGYSFINRGVSIFSLSSSSSTSSSREVKLIDPSEVISQPHNWEGGPRLVHFLTDQVVVVHEVPATAFGCSVLTFSSAETGTPITRYCAPFGSALLHFSIMPTSSHTHEEREKGIVNFAVSNEEGKKFFLRWIGRP